MAGILKALPHYTYADYEQWEGKWELIDGIPYAMSPLPVPKHQRIASAISTEFSIALKKYRHCTVYQPLDYKIEEDTIVQPDMLIVSREIRKKFLDFPPVLIVEILSPSTAFKDRHVKYPLYESQQIPYYLIVSPDTEEVEIYEYKNNRYQLQQKVKEWRYSFLLDGICDATIDFREIW